MSNYCEGTMKNLWMTVGVLGLFVAGCSSSVKKIDTEMDVKGTTQNGSVGVKDGQAVIQQEVMADQELRSQQWRNYELERNLLDEHVWLKRCRTEVADPRLGGNGILADIPDIDQMKSSTQVREDFGITESGQLKFVKREDYMARLKSERSYEDSVKAMLRTVQKSRTSCEREMGYSRVKYGLPATRYQGRMTYTQGGNIDKVLQENENSLDDAFRIRDLLSHRISAGQ